jgi:hypothetical protein
VQVHGNGLSVERTWVAYIRAIQYRMDVEIDAFWKEESMQKDFCMAEEQQLNN